MNELNCDSLKKLPVPPELLQKTLSIPGTADKAVVIPWYRRGRVLASAASILFVATIGLLIYFFIGNINPPVAPLTPPASATAEPTSPGGTPAINATELPTAGERTDATASTEAPKTQPTQPRTAASQEMLPADSAETAPQREASAPLLPTERALNPSAPVEPTETSAPAAQPTEKPAEAPTYPDDIVPQTEPPADKPTDVPEPIEPSENPEPTQSPDEALTFRTQMGVNHSMAHDVIYCRIYNRDTGVVLGEPDRYADSHKAECVIIDNIIYISYCPSAHGITLPPGNYSIAFHNAEGKAYNYYYVTIEEES